MQKNFAGFPVSIEEAEKVDLEIIGKASHRLSGPFLKGGCPFNGKSKQPQQMIDRVGIRDFQTRACRIRLMGVTFLFGSGGTKGPRHSRGMKAQTGFG